MRRVLLLTYYFPPHPSVASLRLRGLARYLPEHGWEPTVLTATHPDAVAADEPCAVVRAFDPGEASQLLKARLGLDTTRSFQAQLGVPRAVRERKRSRVRPLFMWVKGLLVYPDDMTPWRPHALEAGRRLLERERFDALLSSSGPASLNLTARELVDAHGLPWVADFRDLWTQHHDYPYGPLRRRLERRLERRTLARVDELITVSRPLGEQLQSLHRARVTVVENGFDPREVAPPTRLTDTFTITYAGGLYRGRVDPTPCLVALRRSIDRGLIDPERVVVRFYGDTQRWLEQTIERLDLGGVVRQLGRVPREEALARQRESQLLLLLGWADARQRGVLTGKVFEYLAARRPILAVGPPGGDDLERLIRDTRAGVYASTAGHVQAALERAYGEFCQTGSAGYAPDAAAVARYGHPQMAARFAAVLDRAVARRGEGAS